MLSHEPGTYVRIVELPNGPAPLPSASGFNGATAYRALGMFNPSETAESYFILSNDHDEMWFICNRHARVVGVLPNTVDMRLPASEAQRRVSPACA